MGLCSNKPLFIKKKKKTVGELILESDLVLWLQFADLGLTVVFLLEVVVLGVVVLALEEKK